MTKAEQLKEAQTALDAAIKALTILAGGTAVSITNGGETQTFETREDCIDFIGRMERRIYYLKQKRPSFRTTQLQVEL